VTLFVAVALLASGYQVYSLIMREGGESRASTRASGIAYEYLQKYSIEVATPCQPGELATNQPVTIDNLPNATLTVEVECPFSDNPDISKVITTIRYGSQQSSEVSNSTYYQGSREAFTAISAGTSHSCGVKAGKAYCWGNPANGRL